MKMNLKSNYSVVSSQKESPENSVNFLSIPNDNDSKLRINPNGSVTEFNSIMNSANPISE